MFYGGGQKRPDSGLSIPVCLKFSNTDSRTVQIPDGGQKDLKNAVDAAVSGAVT